MKITTYVNNENIIAGMTNKDATAPEFNNIALHACVDSSLILENRKMLADHLNCSLEDFVCPSQTHSANFHKVTLAHKGSGATGVNTAILNTDALYTFEPNLVLCSFTADC